MGCMYWIIENKKLINDLILAITIGLFIYYAWIVYKLDTHNFKKIETNKILKKNMLILVIFSISKTLFVIMKHYVYYNNAVPVTGFDCISEIACNLIVTGIIIYAFMVTLKREKHII